MSLYRIHDKFISGSSSEENKPTHQSCLTTIFSNSSFTLPALILIDFSLMIKNILAHGWNWRFSWRGHAHCTDQPQFPRNLAQGKGQHHWTVFFRPLFRDLTWWFLNKFCMHSKKQQMGLKQMLIINLLVFPISASIILILLWTCIYFIIGNILRFYYMASKTQSNVTNRWRFGRWNRNLEAITLTAIKCQLTGWYQERWQKKEHIEIYCHIEMDVHLQCWAWVIEKRLNIVP